MSDSPESLLKFPTDVPVKVFGRNDHKFRAAAIKIADTTGPNERSGIASSLREKTGPIERSGRFSSRSITKLASRLASPAAQA